jgi:hypothetical protein
MVWLIIALLLHLIAWASDRARAIRRALNLDLTVAGDPTVREGVNAERRFNRQ